MPTKRKWFGLGREYHVHDWGQWEIVSEQKEPVWRERVIDQRGQYGYITEEITQLHKEEVMVLCQRRKCEECGRIELDRKEIEIW